MATKSDKRDCKNCRICLSSLTNPRLLNCLHIFCTSCLEALAGDNTKLTCPLCRAIELLPMTGVKGIPVYQSTAKLEIMEENTDSICQLCEDRKLPSVKCLDCDVYLCSDCHGYHSKLKMSKSHQYERLENSTGGPKGSTCNNHKKKLTFFCKPCNKAMCAECSEIYHRGHEVLSLDYAAAIERDTLDAAVIGLRSNVIQAIENVIDQANSLENALYKQSNQRKQEIKTHATALKEVFCRYVDVAMNLNLIKTEKLTKHEIKQIVAYRDVLEMDQISFAFLLHTTEEIIRSSTNAQLVKESPNLKRRMDNINRYEKRQLQTHMLKFTSGQMPEEQIRSAVGNVEIVVADILKLSFHQLPIPELQMVKSLTLKNSFYTSAIKSIVSGKEGNTWVLRDSRICSYTCNGNKISTKNIDSSNISTLLRRQDGSIFIWMINYARQFDCGEDAVEKVYKVPFEVRNACCFLSNNNLVVFNPTEKTFYEIDVDGGVQRTVNNENLSRLLASAILHMIETDDKNWIIAQGNKVLTIRPDGRVQNVIQKEDGIDRRFQNLCSDNYGNIFAIFTYSKQIDQSNVTYSRQINQSNVTVSDIILLNSDGTIRNKLYSQNNFSSGVDSPMHMTKDDFGNIWICNNNTTVNIFSYL